MALPKIGKQKWSGYFFQKKIVFWEFIDGGVEKSIFSCALTLEYTIARLCTANRLQMYSVRKALYRK